MNKVFTRIARSGGFTVSLGTAAAFLLLLSLKFPLWQMRLEAPQYRDEEALRISVYPNKLGGDIHEITVLDQYIGVHVPPTLPQFKWLPAALIVAAMLGFITCVPMFGWRSRVQIGTACALAVTLLVAAMQAQFQMHAIGHDRDAKTILIGVHDFTPPFLGTSKIAQFTVSSRLGLGAWLIGAALALQLGGAWLGRPIKTRVNRIQPQNGPTGSLGQCDSMAAYTQTLAKS